MVITESQNLLISDCFPSSKVTGVSVFPLGDGGGFTGTIWGYVSSPVADSSIGCSR